MKSKIVKVEDEILNIEDDKFTHKMKLEKIIKDSINNQNVKNNRRLILALRSLINNDDNEKIDQII